MLLLVAAASLAAATMARADDYLDPSHWKQYVETAQKHEARAQQLLATRNYASARREIDQASQRLGAIVISAAVAPDRGDLAQGEAQTITRIADAANKADFAAEKAARARNAAAAKKALAEASRHKQQLVKAIVDAFGAAKRCLVTKEFDVYGIPDGYSGAYADVYPHGIPKDAKNIRVNFLDEVTRKAPAPQLFPGQTWKATVKGFLPDGRFDVRIDVTGTGFGAPDANKRHWSVLVTYDC